MISQMIKSARVGRVEFCDSYHILYVMPFSTIIYIVILLISVVLHELAHAFAADRLGDPTPRLAGRLSFNPLVHLDWFGSVLLPALLIIIGTPFVFGWAKPVPFNPYQLRNQKWGGAMVAAAGPLVNIIIAVLCSLALSFVDPQTVLNGILELSILTNIVLAVFNLIPVPPLDGHHILFAFLPESMDRFKEQLRSLAWPLVFMVVLFGFELIEPVIRYLFDLLV